MILKNQEVEMKQDNFFNRMKKQIKKFIKGLKNKNTSFFV